MPDNDLVEISLETLRMGKFTGDEDVRDDDFLAGIQVTVNKRAVPLSLPQWRQVSSGGVCAEGMSPALPCCNVAPCQATTTFPNRSAMPWRRYVPARP